MYIGNDLQIAHPSYKIIDDISSGFNGSTTSFALQVSGATPVPFPISTQQVMISVNGVVQEPDPTGSAGFKLLGSNIVFSSAPANGHAFFGVINAGADYVTAGSEFPDGSATAPSFTFQDDQDTGWFRSGSGSVGYSANGVQTLTFDGNGLTVTGDASFVGDSAKNLLWDKSDGALEFADNAKAIFGAGNDLSLYHNGNHSFLENVTGDLYLRSDDDIFIQVGTGNELAISAENDGAVALYFDAAKKLETTAGGIAMSGVENAGAQIKVGIGNDIQIEHDGSNSYFSNTTGHLSVQSDDLRLTSKTGGESYLKGVVNGAVELYHNNVKKFETNSWGIKGYGYFAVDGSSGYAYTAPDNAKVSLGTGNDLQLWHDSSNSYITNTTGVINIQAKQTENSIVLNPDGAVELYHNNVKKFETTSSGSKVTGTLITDVLTVYDSTTPWITVGYQSGQDHRIQWDSSKLQLKADPNNDQNQSQIILNVDGSDKLVLNKDGEFGIGGANYGTSGQVLTSGGTGSAASWTTISAAPEITATASGAIAAGKPVAVNTNGTVSTIVSTFNAVNPPSLIYQEENDNTFNASGLDCCYDAGNDRWFVATKFSHPSYLNRWGFRVYQDKADSGTWTLGQGGAWDAITGNGMGWGQMVLAEKGKPLFFYLNGNSLQAKIGTYDSSNEDISWSTVNETGGGAGLQAATASFSVARIEDNKFAILFQNSSGNKCACIIATLSGTNLTKHTEVELSGTNETQIPKIMWDSTNSRLVAHYAGHLRTGTLSGNSQTWGSESSAFSYSGSTTSFSDIAYDVSADRYIICFYNSSNQGCYVLGTRSGNNMSVSSVYVYQSSSAVSHPNVAYNPEIERIAIAYSHSSGGNSGKIRQGKITPSANPPISFGSDYSYGSSQQKFMKLFYSTTHKTFFGMWQKTADNGKNQAARWNVGSLSSTSTSFVGFVDSAVSDGNTATIKVSGNTTTGQSGLTTGTKYYIGRSGGLVTTAETPEVVAGVALSASSLLIQ